MSEQEKYAVFMGFACVDEYYKMSVWPAVGEKANAKYVGPVAGGMIANAACVCAGYGVKTHMFDICSAVANQDFLYEDLKANHVETSMVLRLEGKEDNRCIIFQFPDGDRSIVCVNPEPARYHLNEDQMAFLKQAEYVYGTIGYGDMVDDVKALMNTLKENGVKLFFDVESNYYREDWRDFISCAYTVSMNEWGLETFRKGAGLEEEAFIQELFGLGIQNLLLTLGEKGCRLLTKDGLDISLPAYQVDIVDCTGAGDTINATFMACCMLGYDVEEALRLANAAAAMSITKEGPRGGITTIKEIQAFLKEHQ